MDYSMGVVLSFTLSRLGPSYRICEEINRQYRQAGWPNFGIEPYSGTVHLHSEEEFLHQR